MKRNQKGHRMANITDEEIIDAVELCQHENGGDVSTSDVAHLIVRDRSAVLRKLKLMELAGKIKHRDVRGAGGLLALWSVDCFKNFNTESEKCKMCNSAVECYEASELTKVDGT